MTIHEIESTYLIYLVGEKGLSEKTYSAYEKDLDEFISLIGDKEIEKVNDDDISSYVEYLKKKGLQTSSIIRKETALRCFFRYIEEENKMTLSLHPISLPKKEKKLPVYLTSEEVNRFLQSIDSTTEKGLLDKMLVLIAFSCGLRVSELVSLRIDHIYFKGNYLKVFGKRRKERILPFNEETKANMEYYLKHYRNNIQENPLYFFVHPDGKLVSRQYFFLEVKKYAHLAGMDKKISPHTLRHSFATALLTNGASLVQVKTLLGHEDIKTTEIYTHLTHQKEKEVYEKAMEKSGKVES